ncbi:MAG TPA: Holliday junction branch migration protein RuvA [Saprospiraceae bacterium]|nr:Holliday junction branch migration protein RuvA [Saprospiraceae bacterium]
MYGYIKGKLTSKTPTYVFLDCSGVGYQINVSLNTYGDLPEDGEVKLFTHLQVKEDDLSLWGFLSESEKQLFVLLISVSGVGANTARVIMSYLKAEELHKIIANGDAVSLSKIKGLGPKTAQKIIIDLRDKVVKLSGIEANPTTSIGIDNKLRDDALSALLALGFVKTSVEKAINQVLQKNPHIDQVETLIKDVLKQMS